MAKNKENPFEEPVEIDVSGQAADQDEEAGGETDPAVRIAELERRRDQIDAEIARVRDGDLPLLDDTALKERFQ